jgi:hypothetical protein
MGERRERQKDKDGEKGKAEKGERQEGRQRRRNRRVRFKVEIWRDGGERQIGRGRQDQIEEKGDRSRQTEDRGYPGRCIGKIDLK